MELPADLADAFGVDERVLVERFCHLGGIGNLEAVMYEYSKNLNYSLAGRRIRETFVFRGPDQG